MTAFGKPVASGLASQIMDSPSLTQSPSPASPEMVPGNEIAMKYATLLAISTDLMQIETDQIRRLTLAENVQFYDRAVRAAITASGSGGAQAPVTLPPLPAAAGPPGGTPPPAAMGAPPGMTPPSPPPPGVGMPPGMPQGA